MNSPAYACAEKSVHNLSDTERTDIGAIGVVVHPGHLE